MKRLLLSLVLSIICALIVGVLTQAYLMGSLTQAHPGVMIFKPTLWAAVLYSLIINMNFFYIRRWDGCIEKLGGATFSFFTLIATLLPFVALKNHLPAYIKTMAGHYLIIVTLQIIVIGFISTHFLRTSHFKPPKPGEKWAW